MTGPSVLKAPSRVPSGYMLCLGDQQTAVGLQFPQSETPTPAPATGELVWTAAGYSRLLNGPQSAGEMGMVGVSREGEFLGQLNGVQRAEVTGSDVNALEIGWDCLSEFVDVAMCVDSP